WSPWTEGRENRRSPRLLRVSKWFTTQNSWSGSAKNRLHTRKWREVLLSVFFPGCQEIVGLSLKNQHTSGRLPVPKEVNRKKMEETGAASLTPPGSREFTSPATSYLHPF
ncbi:DNA segment, human D4S114, isoform CRA_b, partial [Mus musculus]